MLLSKPLRPLRPPRSVYGSLLKPIKESNKRHEISDIAFIHFHDILLDALTNRKRTGEDVIKMDKGDVVSYEYEAKPITGSRNMAAPSGPPSPAVLYLNGASVQWILIVVSQRV